LPGLTAKACPSMTDAFSLDFIIPLPFAVRIRAGRGGTAQYGEESTYAREWRDKK